MKLRMRIKVDKEEYERLLKRVEELEEYRQTEEERYRHNETAQ